MPNFGRAAKVGYRSGRRLLAAYLAGGDPPPLLLKLADAHYLLGDLATEKALRERIYGSLDPQREERRE